MLQISNGKVDKFSPNNVAKVVSAINAGRPNNNSDNASPLDVPDLIAMAAPRACMVVGGTEDLLFPPLGQKEATRQIAEAFRWAGSPELFRSYAPAKPHCYDRDIQEEALDWFNKHLKAGKE